MRLWRILFLLALPFLLRSEQNRLGEVFPIQEESLIEYIQKNLSKSDADKKLSEIGKTLLEKAKTPAPVLGLKNATKTRSFLLDMTYLLKEDIKTSDGKIIAKAGTRINPLESICLTSGLLFIDGDQPKHLEWARSQKENYKWILVKGKPIDLENAEKRRIFFDQGGKYTSRFKIENIPSKIVQEGCSLKVEEHGLADP